MLGNQTPKNLLTKKRLQKIKNFFLLIIKISVLIFFILSVIIFIKFGWLLTPSIYQNRKLPNQENTALVLVIENNNYLNFDQLDSAFFKKIALLIDPLNKKRINQMDTPQLIDEYFEDYLAKKILAYSKQYNKVVYLTDQTASYSNFLEVIENLSNQKYKIDLLLHLHGGEKNIWFTNQNVSSNQLTEDLIKIRPNICYVYQTLCYGYSQLRTWEQIGVKNANGAKDINNYVVFAPIKYSQYRQQGKGFLEASKKAYLYEKNLYHQISIFIPQLKIMTSPKAIKGSEFQYIHN